MIESSHSIEPAAAGTGYGSSAGPSGSLARGFPKSALPALLVLVWAGSTLPTQAQSSQEITVPWSELASLVRDENVRVTTASGAVVEGRASGVTPDRFHVHVRRSSDRQAYPHGPHAFLRSDVVEIQVRRLRGKGRAIGAAIGAGGGVALGWLVAEGIFHVGGEGRGLWREPRGVVSVLAGGAGGAALGYLLGRERDLETIHISPVLGGVIPGRWEKTDGLPSDTAIVLETRFQGVVTGTFEACDDSSLTLRVADRSSRFPYLVQASKQSTRTQAESPPAASPRGGSAGPPSSSCSERSSFTSGQ
jgi:hypothetical protein